MELNQLINTNEVLDIVLKWGFVLVFTMFFVFTLLIYRQVQLMSRTLAGLLEPALKLIAVGLIVGNLVVLVMAVMVL